MTTTSYFQVFELLQVSPVIIYDFISHGIEAERARYQALEILNNRATLESYRKILQGERVLAFMRRGISAEKLLDHSE